MDVDTKYARSETLGPVIAQLPKVVPLDAQTGVWPLKTVPDALIEPLFGPSSGKTPANTAPPEKTYAILDAAKIQFGLQLLNGTDLPFKCLFKGKAEDELQDVAPYIVELDADHSFTRVLFTHIPKSPPELSSVHLWHAQPGIYVRSHASLDDLRTHFRKFTRLYSEETDKWHYFRFYAPETLRNVVAHLDNTQFEKFAGPCSAFLGQTAEGGMIQITRSGPHDTAGATQW